MECFTCFHCHKPIHRGLFHLENGQPYCDEGTMVMQALCLCLCSSPISLFQLLFECYSVCSTFLVVVDWIFFLLFFIIWYFELILLRRFSGKYISLTDIWIVDGLRVLYSLQSSWNNRQVLVVRSCCFAACSFSFILFFLCIFLCYILCCCDGHYTIRRWWMRWRTRITWDVSSAASVTSRSALAASTMKMAKSIVRKVLVLGDPLCWQVPHIACWYREWS